MIRSVKQIKHPILKSALVAMLVARIQKSGKKSVAEKLIIEVMLKIQTKTTKPPLIVFEAAVRKLMPEVALVSQRVGASVYQIPRPISIRTSIPLAIKWLIEAALAKKSKSISDALAGEILDAFNGQGSAITKSQQNKRMAEANLVYAHLGKRLQNKTSKAGRKIFKSRLESREKKAVQKLSKVKRRFRQIPKSVYKNYDFHSAYKDQLWYP